MYQIFHKIVRKPLNGNAIRSLINHQSPTQPLLSHLVHYPQPTTKNPNLESLSEDKSAHFSRLDLYPSFSFGYLLNPISPSGLPDFKPEEDLQPDGSDSGTMIWADSVKKKRKKKMNKHKLKKLKKRLRHCS